MIPSDKEFWAYSVLPSAGGASLLPRAATVDDTRPPPFEMKAQRKGEMRGAVSYQNNEFVTHGHMPTSPEAFDSMQNFFQWK